MDLSPAVSAWASRFFSAQNSLEWSKVLSGTAEDGWAAEILPWLSLLEGGDLNIPAVLPFVSKNGEVCWYAMARTARGASQLAEELQAFVGPSYSDFDGRPH